MGWALGAEVAGSILAAESVAAITAITAAEVIGSAAAFSGAASAFTAAEAISAAGVVGQGVGLVMQATASKQTKAAASRQATALEGQGAEQRKQFEAQQRIADIQNARARAEQARKARVARAQVINQGALTGTLNSSGVQGGTGSIQTQAASSIGEFSAVGNEQGNIIESQKAQASFVTSGGQAQADIVKAGATSAVGQNIFNLGAEMFKAAGGYRTIFDMAK